MNTVFVVGSLNIDQNVRVRSLPRSGETVSGTDATFSPGGKGGNQAVAAARAGAAVEFMGAVGDDAHGQRILEVLTHAGVDCSQVPVIKAMPTGTAIIAVDDAGENLIIVSPGANSRLTKEDIDAFLSNVRSGDVLTLQLEIPAGLVRHAARQAKARGALVVLNAAPAPAGIDGLFDDVDLLVVNEHEIQILAGLTGIPPGDHRDLVRTLPALLGPRIVCTAGDEGAYTVIDDALLHVPAPAVDVADTTGAGDTFIGYLVACLLANPADLAGAMTSSCRASALAVTRSGAMESIPWLHEVEPSG
jgi:ribokinase